MPWKEAGGCRTECVSASGICYHGRPRTGKDDGAKGDPGNFQDSISSERRAFVRSNRTRCEKNDGKHRPCSDDDSPALYLSEDEPEPTDIEPIQEDLVIVDEATMVDMKLAATLFSRLKSGCRLILVGDADQLPSVGPGTYSGN